MAHTRRWALLIILQGMDASGKDGAIKHVMAGLNPQGCEVHAFKHPSAEELEHGFLWRAARRLPARGRIGNRSYYEDALVVRVRRELLGQQNLPAQLVTKAIWSERFNSIRAFERPSAQRHVGAEIPIADLPAGAGATPAGAARRTRGALEILHGRFGDRMLWCRYMEADDDAIRNTATAQAPWYVVPADHKWFAWLMVAAVVADALERLDLRFPVVRGKALAELEGTQRVGGRAAKGLISEGALFTAPWRSTRAYPGRKPSFVLQFSESIAPRRLPRHRRGMGSSFWRRLQLVDDPVDVGSVTHADGG